MKLNFISDIKKSNKSCSKYNGVKRYIETGNIIDTKIVGFEEYTYDKKPSRANVCVSSGTVLVAKMQNSVKVLLINEETENYIYSTGFYAFKDQRILPSFLKYYFLSPHFNYEKNIMCNGNTQKAINDEGMKKIYITVHHLEDQVKIADYLDSNCAKIDSIIEKQQVIIEKLKEYKVSMINEMTNVEEGTLCHLGFIGQMKNGLNFTDTSEGVNVKFLGVSDFKDYFFLENEEQFSTVIINTDISEDYYLKNGDIIFVRSNGSKELVGRAVMVNNISFPLTYSGFCIRFRNTRQDIIDSKFLLYYFRSYDFRKKLEKYSQGSNINNVNQDLLSSISIVIPPIKYQTEALKKLEINCNKIDEMVYNTITIINKLIEYKQSIIYEVVTGKKEV